jgi:hypothetical protein
LEGWHRRVDELVVNAKLSQWIDRSQIAAYLAGMVKRLGLENKLPSEISEAVNVFHCRK